MKRLFVNCKQNYIKLIVNCGSAFTGVDKLKQSKAGSEIGFLPDFP